MTPEELRVNAGWSVKPEYKEYVRRQAERENLSSSRYVENLILADMEIRSMEEPDEEPAPRTAKKK